MRRGLVGVQRRYDFQDDDEHDEQRGGPRILLLVLSVVPGLVRRRNLTSWSSMRRGYVHSGLKQP